MNVFVLSTGRCGSTTFEQACLEIRNYTTAHESLTHCLGAARLNYPDNHIESDNRLSWFLGRLDQKYGDRAFYVHLKRNRDQVAQSYAKRVWPGSILQAYANGILLRRKDKPAHVAAPRFTPVEAAADYVDTVTQNIELFLKDKTHKMDFDLERADESFQRFWAAIGAQGDLDKALAAFSMRYNSSPA